MPQPTRPQSARLGDAAWSTLPDQPRVLVVEDDTVLCRLIVRALQSQYCVASATDGSEGLRKALETPPDLVLSDMRMPGMSGLELLRAIRADPHLQDVPFILLTAMEDQTVRLSALSVGATDYLTKPCSFREIKLRVANHVSVKRARDLLRQELTSTSRDLEELALQVAESRRRDQDALHAREQFLLEVAHELRAPVTNVLGAAELLVHELERKRPLPEARLKQLVSVIEHQARRLARLVNESLDLSRLDGGAIDLQVSETDIVTLVRAAVRVLEATGVDHPLHVFAPHSLLIAMDRLRIEQVLMHLLDNAVTYSPSGTRVDIQVESVSPETVEISVRDHGPGIAPERRGQLFDRFFQVNAGQHFAGHVGLGVGLYISRKIVEQHRGQLTAEFPPDGGSRFVVRLPLR
jgi:signal transduction histidine kinase